MFVHDWLLGHGPGGRRSRPRPPRGRRLVAQGRVAAAGVACRRQGSVALAGRGRTDRSFHLVQAARPKTWWTKARWAGMSLAGTARTCPLVSIAIASTPARVRRAVQKLPKPSMGSRSALDAPVVLLDPVV